VNTQLHKNTYLPMSNSSTTRLYGGIERPSIQSEIAKSTLPTAFFGILALLRFAQEGFTIDLFSIILFATAVLLFWRFRE